MAERYKAEFALARAYPEVETHPDATRWSTRIVDKEKARDKAFKSIGAGQFKGSLKEKAMPASFSSTEAQRHDRPKLDERKGNKNWSAMKSAWRGDNTDMDDDKENAPTMKHHPLTHNPSRSPAAPSRRPMRAAGGGPALTELSQSAVNGLQERHQASQTTVCEDDQVDVLNTDSSEIAHLTRMPTVTEQMEDNGLDLTMDNLKKMGTPQVLQSISISREHAEVLHNDTTDLIFHAFDMAESIPHLVRPTDYIFSQDASREPSASSGFFTAYEVLQHCSSLLDSIDGPFRNYPEHPSLSAIEIKMSTRLRSGIDLQDPDKPDRTDLPNPTLTVKMSATTMFNTVAWIKSHRHELLNNVAGLGRNPTLRDSLWRRIFLSAPHICRSKEFLVVLLLAPKSELTEMVSSRFRVDEGWYNWSVEMCLRGYCEASGLNVDRAMAAFKEVKHRFD